MFLALIILSVAAIGWADANCGPCPEIPKHYEELGCKGIYAKDGGCCPERLVSVRKSIFLNKIGHYALSRLTASLSPHLTFQFGSV